jgi:hypothetical protein
MTTAPAPAFAALVAFVANVQAPRWTSAMSPAGNPAKSAGSQPRLAALETGAVTSSLPE